MQCPKTKRSMLLLSMMLSVADDEWQRDAATIPYRVAMKTGWRAPRNFHQKVQKPLGYPKVGLKIFFASKKGKFGDIFGQSMRLDFSSPIL